MKPTIIHACDYASEYGGNFIASISQLRDECRRQGWEFVLVLPQGARERPWCVKLVAANWRVLFLPQEASAVRCAGLLARLAFQENIQLIHTHFSRFDTAAWFAAKISGLFRRRPIRVVWHSHSDFQVDISVMRRLKDMIKFRLMGGSAHIIIVSDHLKERPLAAGFDAKRLHVISNGIDFSRIDGERDRPDPFAEMGVKKDAAVLMFGWHPFVKGVDVALAAFEIVARTRRDLRLLIVGSEQTWGEVARIYPKGNPIWLRLLPPVDNVAEYFQGAGMFLSASRREGFSYSVFEATASRCLLVSSDIPALKWIENSIRCWWFRNQDPIDLAARIIECASLGAIDRQEVTRTNSAFVREHLSLERWAVAVVGAYSRICDTVSAVE